MLNYICPVCKAAAKAPCLFKVKDGHQSLPEGTVHLQRARLDYVMEALEPKQQEGESDLDFVMRIDKVIEHVTQTMANKVKPSMANIRVSG